MYLNIVWVLNMDMHINYTCMIDRKDKMLVSHHSLGDDNDNYYLLVHVINITKSGN